MKALLACVVLLLGAMLAADVEVGRACSCALPNPRAALAQGDGAFVGKLVGRREAGQQAVVLTFSVERALKGSIGSTVKVVTASSSAACGIELRTGHRTGLVLERRGGTWQGYLCSQFDPDELLAAALPLPVPNGRGPVALILGAELGDARLLALDTRGRTLAYGRGGGRTLVVSFCPGGRRLVEIAATTSGTGTVLVVRETRTLRVMRRHALRLPTFRYPQRLRCQDRSGSSILFARGGRGSVTRSALYRIREGGLRIVWEGSAHDAAITASSAYLSAGRRGRQLVRVDLTTGRVRLIAVLPGAATSLAVDHRETRLAAIRNRGAGRSDVMAVELRTGRVRARGISPREVQGQLAWLPTGRLLFLPAWGTAQARLLDTSLRVRSRFAWNAASGAVVGRSVFGIGLTPTLSSASLPAGPQRAVRLLPGRASLIVSATS